MMLWKPHWLFAEFKLDFVEWNPAETCIEKTQQRDTACGFEQATVSKVVWSGFEQKWPSAYRLLQEIQISNDDQIKMIHAIDQKKQPLEDVVSEWISANESTWRQWAEAAKK